MAEQAAAENQGRYLGRLPGALRRALFAGQWLPVLGAGISATAATEDGRQPPGWAGLGKALAADVPAADPDTRSTRSPAYGQLYGRVALLERLTDLLLVNDVEPSAVHAAFARLPFDIVVTTNVDFLLEAAYQAQQRPCIPLLGESQLSTVQRPEVTHLPKFHGDLRHPDELVMTRSPPLW